MRIILFITSILVLARYPLPENDPPPFIPPPPLHTRISSGDVHIVFIKDDLIVHNSQSGKLRMTSCVNPVLLLRTRLQYIPM